MRTLPLAAALVVLAAPAFAQDAAPITFSVLEETASLEPVAPPIEGGWATLGGRVGYLKTRGAERGTWLVGVQARYYAMEYVAFEAAISGHEDDFEGFDVQTWPVELSVLLFPLQDMEVKPYIVGGAGWYYSRIDYDDEALDDETDNFFAVHLGAGAEYSVNPQISFNADFRWVFVNDPDLEVDEEEFDYWQFTAGFNYKF